MSAPDPGAWLLDRIDLREKALTSHIEQIQGQIEELTARLRELDQDLDHLRITRRPCSSWPSSLIRHSRRHRLP